MHSDDIIIEGFRNRNQELILAFYDQITPAAVRVLGSMGASDEDIEDLVQEMVVSIYTNIRSKKYVHDPNVKLSTYAIQICKYRWYNLSKRKSRKNISLDIENVSIVDDQKVDEQIETIERNNLIAKALKQLNEQCQQILRMFYWERKSMEEIASELNMQPNSAKNGKYRCMNRLSIIIRGMGKDMML
jgi:RNA polymerase sigma factor (sigma-70 family)